MTPTLPDNWDPVKFYAPTPADKPRDDGIKQPKPRKDITTTEKIISLDPAPLMRCPRFYSINNQ